MQLRLTRILLMAAQRAAERELKIALAQRVVGDLESRQRIESAQQALAAVRKDLQMVEARIAAESERG